MDDYARGVLRWGYESSKARILSLIVEFQQTMLMREQERCERMKLFVED